MSGFVCLVRTDGPPLECGVLEPFMDALASRGPHARWGRRSSDAALGHTLFRLPGDLDCERQPLGKSDVWIVADARIDARADLIRDLGDIAISRPASDAMLILQAYLKWGDACVDHLLGDFAFAIWDARTPRLFCARDQMGVKPFYYASLSEAIVVSNTLDCVRRHPSVSASLNDAAIADCVLFGGNQDSQTSVYQDVKRLPGGHTLTWSSEGLRVRRYWELPIDEPVYYRRAGDYIDRFNELLGKAVFDRVRGTRTGVFMSGGLDSTLLAATANSRSSVRAFTFTYASLIPDRERAFAEAAARHLNIPLSITELDRSPAWLAAEMPAGPEPLASPSDPSPIRNTYAEMAAHSAIALHGEGPDNALNYEWQPHLAQLGRQRRWGRLAADVVRHAWSHRRVPLVSSIPRMIRRRNTPDQWALGFPEALRPELVDRLQLKERWHQVNASVPSMHPTRPAGYASMASPLWQNMFEALDTSHTGALLEVRHPYVDLRLLRFMLSLPAMPWCRRKFILRQAARPLLPPVIVDRDKTPLAALPDEHQARRHGPPRLYPSEDIGRYTTLDKFEVEGSRSVTAHQAHFYLAAVSHWLHTRKRFA